LNHANNTHNAKPIPIHGSSKKAPTFIKIGNPEFQKLYFKIKTFDEFYESYRQACRYGVNYLRDKPMLSSRDVAIIAEVMSL